MVEEIKTENVEESTSQRPRVDLLVGLKICLDAERRGLLSPGTSVLRDNAKAIDEAYEEYFRSIGEQP